MNSAYLFLFEISDLCEALFAGMNFTMNISVLSMCDVVYFSKDVAIDESNNSDFFLVQRLIDEALPFLRKGVTQVLLF